MGNTDILENKVMTAEFPVTGGWSLRTVVGLAVSSEPSGAYVHMYNTFFSLFKMGKLLEFLLLFFFL